MSAAAEPHDPHLAHHFTSPAQQYAAVKLGMWIFIATEVLFFGGLFCAYTVYRVNHPEIFVWAHQFLSKTLGAVNTVILICSSFTMAWAVRASQLRQKRLLILMLALTLACSFGFLGVKAVEYNEKWRHGLLWASRYNPTEHAGEGTHAKPGAAAEADPAPVPRPPAPAQEAAPAPVPPAAEAPAAKGPPGLATEAAAAVHEALSEPRNARIFFSIYFLMTGVHGLHVLGGMGAMAWLLVLARRGALTGGYFTPVDMVGLYWHLVDMIWIYLFLLLYLIE